MSRIRQFASSHWGSIAAAYAYAASVAGATAAIAAGRHHAGAAAPIATILLWQAIVYGLWLPVALVLYRLFKLSSLKRAAILSAGTGVAAIMAHAAVAALLDRQFGLSSKGGLALLTFERVPVDILIFTAIGAAVAANVAYGRSELLRRALAAAKESESTSKDETERLLVSVGNAQVPIPVSAIESVLAAGNYVVVNWEEREGLLRGTLRELEERLDPAIFARCHRSAIVNLAQVASASWLADGSWRLEMRSGMSVVVSRSYRDAILARLGRKDLAQTRPLRVKR